MNIHFFQRYHSKENVDTANAMLLLSRLYTYSTDKFYLFLRGILPDSANIELSFNIQEKIEKGTVPDATITQTSFKIVIETKLYNQFEINQLTGHLDSFRNEDYKVLLTLDPSPLKDNLKHKLDEKIANLNGKLNSNIVHYHTTFEELINNIAEVIDERDYEMQDILDDYREYCYIGKLIPDDWKRMRVQLAGTTLPVNKQLNLYYDNADRGFSGHTYLGLYNQKAVRVIGKISSIVTAIIEKEKLIVTTELGECTNEMKERIIEAIDDSKQYGYNLSDILHRYFFVDKFYDTYFVKESKRAPMGSRIFDLCEVLEVDDLPEDTEEIANLLKTKTWE